MPDTVVVTTSPAPLVVKVETPGPQGPPGATGPTGPMPPLSSTYTGDLNNLTETGFYTGSSLTNHPGISSGYIIVNGTGNFTTQVFEVSTGDRIWHRSRSAGTWTAWRELYGPPPAASAPSGYYAYVPTVTNWTAGNATINGRYMTMGKFCHYEIEFTFGSTSVASGNFRISLPASATNGAIEAPRGIAVAQNAAGTTVVAHTAIGSTTGANYITLKQANGTYLAAGTPLTWATGDLIRISGSFITT